MCKPENSCFIGCQMLLKVRSTILCSTVFGGEKHVGHLRASDFSI